MTNTSSTPPVKNVSVGVATHICKITVHVTLQHTGSAGDFVTIHDRFLVALEALATSTIPADGGEAPAVQIQVNTEPLSSPSSTSRNDTDEWRNLEDSTTDDALTDDPATDDASFRSSSPASIDNSMPDLEAPIFHSPGDTRPNTPVTFDRDVENGYHIIYGCDVHGQQNHYGPYCGCAPFPVSVNMPPRLADGTFPPILPNGSIPWPPLPTTTSNPVATPTSITTLTPATTPDPVAADDPIATLTPAIDDSEVTPPDYTSVVGTSTQPGAVAGTSTLAMAAAGTSAQAGAAPGVPNLAPPHVAPQVAGTSTLAMAAAGTSAQAGAAPGVPNLAPPPVAPQGGSFYAVTSGVRTGVFDDWFIAAPLVVRISGACYKKYPTRQAAEDAYQRALAAGAVSTLA